MKRILLLSLFPAMALGAFAQLAPQVPAPLSVHLREVNTQWSVQDPNPADGDRIVADIMAGFVEPARASVQRDRARAIAQAIGCAPSEILFLSDHTGELDAAAAAGMRVICLDRGEAVVPADTPHRRVRSFAEIAPGE